MKGSSVTKPSKKYTRTLFAFSKGQKTRKIISTSDKNTKGKDPDYEHQKCHSGIAYIVAE